MSYLPRVIRNAFALSGLLALSAFTRPAAAQLTIGNPGDHYRYGVEIEPHFIVGVDGNYASSGFGGGVRASIPLVANGFVTTINNNVAITFGLDWLHYSGCYYNGPCSADYLFLPIALQWNFFFTRQWSAFGELGIAGYHGFYNDCAGNGCPIRTSVYPGVAIGGRYSFTDHVALTLRIGFPALSLGVSFL